MKKNFFNKGQSLLEYTILITIIASVVMAMTTYVYRAVQGTQQRMSEVVDG